MPKKKVLLCIDDEPTGLMVRKLVLETAGYEVLTAHDGLTGLQLFRDEAIDAVVLDFAMPGLDGSQVARRMRQLKPAVPILLLSAYVSLPGDVLDSMDSYVTKGQAPAVLLEHLRRLLHEIPRHSHPELQGEYVAFVDRQRRYIEVTDGFCRLLGYTREQLLQLSVDDVATMPSVPDRFQRYLADGSQEGQDMLRHRDGTLIPIRYRATVFRDGCMASVMEPVVDGEGGFGDNPPCAK